jgi:type II secretory pathway component PulF
MLAGGLPLIDALRVAQASLRDGPLTIRLRAAISAVESGGSSLADDALGGALDPAEREMLAVGERTGLLAEQWERVAVRRAEDLSARIGRLGVVVEPLLVVLVGALVGGAVLALYLPTFRVLDLL